RNTGAAASRERGVGQGDIAGPPNALAERVGVIPRHRQLFARLLELAGSANWDPDDNASHVAEPELHGGSAIEQRLVTHCGRRLADVVRGEIDERELLFGEHKEYV